MMTRQITIHQYHRRPTHIWMLLCPGTVLSIHLGPAVEYGEIRHRVRWWQMKYNRQHISRCCLGGGDSELPADRPLHCFIGLATSSECKCVYVSHVHVIFISHAKTKYNILYATCRLQGGRRNGNINVDASANVVNSTTLDESKFNVQFCITKK